MKFDRLLSPAEAAGVLHISERHLRNLTSSGRIAAIRLGRSVRYHPDEMNRLISEGLPRRKTEK